MKELATRALTGAVYVALVLGAAWLGVQIAVTDNGIGIPPEFRDRIFEPKFTTKTSGMGLGLGIIKNIIENYKGTITFETQVAKGTTFIVSLPILK